MSANVPTDICFSFTGLMQRGGRTGPHRDGWGVAFYEDRGCRIFHDPNPSADSAIARLIQRDSIKSRAVVCHIRQANRGRVALENTHPFQRELWGRPWVFAHNGQLRGIKRWPLAHYRPIGTTDSEHAFCWVMDALRERFPRPPRRRATLWRFLAGLCERLRALGTCNLLMSDGRVVYAHRTTELHWLTRCAPFGRARLADAEVTVDFAQVTTPADVVTVIATRPLTTDESWTAVPRHTLVAFDAGRPLAVGPRGTGVYPLEPAGPVRGPAPEALINPG